MCNLVKVLRDTVLFPICVSICLISSSVASGQVVPHRMEPYSSKLQTRALAGDSESESALGVAYLEGIAVQRNYPEASIWLTKALNAGSSDAAGWLGGMYLLGQGVPQDIEKARGLINEAKADGSPIGVRFTALMAEKGIGQTMNTRLAFNLYQMAAAHFDPVSCDRVGLGFEAGKYKKVDLSKAAAFYQCGARGGYSWSYLHLGELYSSDKSFTDRRSGKTKDVNPWLPQAVEMFGLGAAQGNRIAEYRLAQCLRDGRGVARDLKAAEQYLSLSSRQQYPPAQESLADLYQAYPPLGGTRVESLTLLLAAASGGQLNARKKAEVLAQTMSDQEIRDVRARVNLLEAVKQTYSTRQLSDVVPN